MNEELQRRKRNAKRRHRRRLKKFIRTAVILLIVGVVVFLCRDWFRKKPAFEPVSGNKVQIHFIDIGQGDAALIRTAAGDVLIDSGDNGEEEKLKAYLDKCEVDDLAYVVFTHPDSDHIGGADVVLENYDVERVIRPNSEAATATYRNMVRLIEEEGAEDIHPDVEYVFRVGEVRFTVLAPGERTYKDTNDSSVVLRMDYGETSILFTGDAEIHSEKDMLSRYGKGADGMLDCDIIKIGHHGSSTSSSEEFLRAVTPDHAIVSCGDNNKHGHPHGEVIRRCDDMNIPVLRTDKEGSIVFVTTGDEPERMAA